MKITLSSRLLLATAFAILCSAPLLSHAQTATTDQLRATIKQEISSDPRSQTMTQAQVNGLVNVLTTQAQKQGLTSAQLTYRPSLNPQSGTTFASCTDLSCALSTAFGLNGSIPFIPIALFVLTVLFIAIYSLMREMGHPHAQG